MTSALRWAVVTTVLTIVAISVPLSMASKRADQPECARGAILVAILGVPLAGGVISLAKGTADRRTCF